MRRGQLFWGVALLLIGALMFANTAGIRLPNGNSLMSLFWPLVLLGSGVYVLAGVFMRRNVETESARVSLEGAREASINISHGAGELKIHGGASGNDLATGSFMGGLDQKASLNGERLEVRMRPASEFVDFPFFGMHAQMDWDVALNASIPTALEMNLGANKSSINLLDMNVTDLRLKSGASDTDVTFPSRGRLKADFEIGAASLTLVIPEGVSARIRSSIGAGDVHVDSSRFPRQNGLHQSPDFETAANAVDINVKGGACSVRIK
jgi:hypothetical protein